jgi:hypothetical protein
MIGVIRITATMVGVWRVRDNVGDQDRNQQHKIMIMIEMLSLIASGIRGLASKNEKATRGWLSVSHRNGARDAPLRDPRTHHYDGYPVQLGHSWP